MYDYYNLTLQIRNSKIMTNLIDFKENLLC